MGYRNIEPNIIHIDSLMQGCGLFDEKCQSNNGYGCKSRSKSKEMPGQCFAFACPLAWEADLEDMKKYDKDLYEEYKTETGEPADVGAGWVIQYRECV